MKKAAPSDLFSRIEAAGYGVFIGKTSGDDADFLRSAGDLPESPEKKRKILEIAGRMEAHVRRHPGDSIRREDVLQVRKMAR